MRSTAGTSPRAATPCERLRELGLVAAAHALDEVVTREDVQEGHEWHDDRHRPRKSRDEADVSPAEEQVDPDQHDGHWMQDAKQELDHFLEHCVSLSPGRISLVDSPELRR